MHEGNFAAGVNSRLYVVRELDKSTILRKMSRVAEEQTSSYNSPPNCARPSELITRSTAVVYPDRVPR